MRLRLEITVEAPDDVTAEDARQAANLAAEQVKLVLKPTEPTAHTWRLVEVLVAGASSR